MVRPGSTSPGQSSSTTAAPPRPGGGHACGVRYRWPSSTWKRASRPQSKRRYKRGRKSRRSRARAAACARSTPGRRRHGDEEVRAQPLRLAVGVVVVDLVIIPCDEPRDGRVQALQIGVGLVLRVPVAVLGERPHLIAEVRRTRPGRAPALVDVVAEEEHQVDVLGLHVAVRPEVADLEVLARREGVAQLRGSGREGPGRCGCDRSDSPRLRPGSGRSTTRRAPADGRRRARCAPAGASRPPARAARSGETARPRQPPSRPAPRGCRRRRRQAAVAPSASRSPPQSTRRPRRDPERERITSESGHARGGRRNASHQKLLPLSDVGATLSHAAVGRTCD